jgi:hypothetical protein
VEKMTNFQHLQEPSLSVSTLKSVLQTDPSSSTLHADPLGAMTHAILDTLHMEEKTHVVDTNHQVQRENPRDEPVLNPRDLGAENPRVFVWV